MSFCLCAKNSGLSLSRRIKAIDKRALPSMTVDDEADSDADEPESSVAAAGAGFKPTRVNPNFLVLYGHAMASGKSYQSAIGERLPALVLRMLTEFYSLLPPRSRSSARRPSHLSLLGYCICTSVDAATK